MCILIEILNILKLGNDRFYFPDIFIKTWVTLHFNLFLNKLQTATCINSHQYPIITWDIQVFLYLIGCMWTLSHWQKLGQALISLMRNLREMRARDYQGCRGTHTPYLVYCWASAVCLCSVSMVILGLFHAEIFWILLICVWINLILPMLWLHWFLKKLHVFVSCFPVSLSLSLSLSLFFSSSYF